MGQQKRAQSAPSPRCGASGTGIYRNINRTVYRYDRYTDIMWEVVKYLYVQKNHAPVYRYLSYQYDGTKFNGLPDLRSSPVRRSDRPAGLPDLKSSPIGDRSPEFLQRGSINTLRFAKGLRPKTAPPASVPPAPKAGNGPIDRLPAVRHPERERPSSTKNELGKLCKAVYCIYLGESFHMSICS